MSFEQISERGKGAACDTNTHTKQIWWGESGFKRLKMQQWILISRAYKN